MIATLTLLPIWFVLLLARPLVVLPLLTAIGYACHKLGVLADIQKQLNWMKRMSGRGPIFWMLASLERLVIRLSRKLYGDRLDTPPKVPKALGTSVRGSTSATVKWIPQEHSGFSSEGYDVIIRAGVFLPRPDDQDDRSPAETDDADGVPEGWTSLVKAHGECELVLKPLVAATPYEVRVRATNSKGSSAWKAFSFVTKQKPLMQPVGSHGGAGGEGACAVAVGSCDKYRWLQSLKDETVLVVLGPLPDGTKGFHIDIGFRPKHLKVMLHGKAVVDGELQASVVPDECSWEIKTLEDGGGRELQISLTKAPRGKEKNADPLWTTLFKGHLEVDMAKVKREEKTLEEIMAELQAADPDGMNKVEKMKDKML